MMIDEAVDCCLQLGDAEINATPDLTFGEESEESLNLVEPGGSCGRQVNMPVRSLGEPSADGLGFVGRIIVHDDVDIQTTGSGRLDLIEEATELA